MAGEVHGRTFWLAAIGILAVAAVLRFHGLAARGLVEWDGAYYVGVARTWGAGLQWLFERYVQNAAGSSLSERLLTDGVAVSPTAKHGLIAIMMFGAPLTGFTELLGTGVAAVAAVATIGMCGLVAATAFNRSVALLSMFLLTFSFTHLHYSRSGFPVSVSALCVTIAWFLYLRSCAADEPWPLRRRMALLAGLMTGLAVTVHYNLFWVPCLFYGLLAWQALRDAIGGSGRDVRHQGGIAGMFLLGSLILPLAFELGTRLLQAFVGASPGLSTAVQGRFGDARLLTYFEEVYLHTVGQGNNFVAREPWFYLRLIGEWEGYGVLAALLASLVWTAVRCDVPALVRASCLGIAALPLLIWTLFSFPVARTIGVATPAWAIVSAASACRAYDHLVARNRRLARVCAACGLIVIAAAGTWRARPIWDVRSGMPAALAFMQEHGSVKHISTEFPLSRLLVGRANAIDATVSFQGKDTAQVLRTFETEDYRYLVASGGRFTSDKGLMAMLEDVDPVFRTHHSFRLQAYEYFDREVQRAILSSPEQLEVYEIRELLEHTQDGTPDVRHLR